MIRIERHTIPPLILHPSSLLLATLYKAWLCLIFITLPVVVLLPQCAALLLPGISSRLLAMQRTGTRQCWGAKPFWPQPQRSIYCSTSTNLSCGRRSTSSILPCSLSPSSLVRRQVSIIIAATSKSEHPPSPSSSFSSSSSIVGAIFCGVLFQGRFQIIRPIRCTTIVILNLCGCSREKGIRSIGREVPRGSCFGNRGWCNTGCWQGKNALS